MLREIYGAELERDGDAATELDSMPAGLRPALVNA
jgi:hypothetical protein